MGTLADLKTMLGQASPQSQATVSVPGLASVAVSSSELYDILPAPAFKTMYVNTPGDVLNVRSATIINTTNIVGKLAHGTKVSVSRTIVVGTRTWAALTDGKIGGWSAAEYLLDNPPAPTKKAGFGYHVFNGQATDQIVAQAQSLKAQGKPLRLVVLINDWQNEHPATDALVSCVDYVVYRDVRADGNPDNPTDAQYASGDGASWVASLMPRYANVNKKAYLQLMNEGEWRPNMGTFWLNAMKYADQIGVKLAIFAFSIGNPNDEGGTTRFQKWAALYPALVYAKTHGHPVIMHAYAGPGTPAGKLTIGANRDNYEGRFIGLWASLPSEAQPDLLFGEVACEYYNGDFQGDDPCVEYMSSFIDYIRPYSYAKGGAAWTVNGTGRWEKANINSAIPALGAMYLRRGL